MVGQGVLKKRNYARNFQIYAKTKLTYFFSCSFQSYIPKYECKITAPVLKEDTQQRLTRYWPTK